MFDGLKQTWDLETIFPGGSASPEFSAYLDSLEADLAKLAEGLTTAGPADAAGWRAELDQLQGLMQRLRHAGAFIACLSAQDVNDKLARQLGGRLRMFHAGFASILTQLDSVIKAEPDDRWEELIGAPELQELSFVLAERRRRAQAMMAPTQETLVNDLSVDGYHGWADLYDLTTGRMSIPLEVEGETVKGSPGQAANRMSDADPAVRRHVMERWEEAWAESADYCALALNHLAGYRLNLYRNRGWESVLREPLENNRMAAGTLDAMWRAIDARKKPLQTYIDRKKRLLRLDHFGWQDVDAPVGRSERKLTYDQAASFIVEQFGRFSPRLAELATRAFEQSWIESEDRPGKRMGGFCTSLPGSRQSRIFFTFSGTMGNLATLAHELGHAYHQHLMNDLPPLNQQYAMNVAETASTFAELIVADAAVDQAADDQEKLVLIEDKLRRAVALLMNIQCRFLFETRFYDERRRGIVGANRLNELMVEAQKEAFADALDAYHPHFWASKLHFYNTWVPFYNFPYTFGYLFSAGVYGRAKEVGPAFEASYTDLLRDTGRMKVEDLAAKHLGVDLTAEEFWGAAVDNVLGDLPQFLRLTD